MVTDLIVDAFMAALDAVLSLLPVVTVPASAVLSFAGDFVGFVVGMQRVVPLADILVLLVAQIAVMLALATFDLGVWIWHQFWGAS